MVGRLGYRFWFLICCINDSTCLVLLDSFLQFRYFFLVSLRNSSPWRFRFFYFCISYRIDFISRLLPTLDFMEWFWSRLGLSIYIGSLFVFLICRMLYSEAFFSISILFLTPVLNCSLDGVGASVFQAHARHRGTVIFSDYFCSWRSCWSTTRNAAVPRWPVPIGTTVWKFNLWLCVWRSFQRLRVLPSPKLTHEHLLKECLYCGLTNTANFAPGT